MPSNKGSLSLRATEKETTKDPINLKKFNALNEEEIDHNDSKEANRKSHSFLSIMCLILSQIKELRIEVVMFLYQFSTSVSRVSTTTLIVDKVCLVHYNFSDTICSNLSAHPDLKSMVLKLANNYTLGYTLINFLPASILVCFIGSWSDKYSRKIPLAVAMLGTTLDDIGSTLAAVFMNSRAEMLLVAGLFNGSSGGFLVFLTVCYSYNADISTFSNRTMKFTLLSVALGISGPLGTLAGGYIFKETDYTIVFLTATMGHLLGLLWIILFVTETRGLDNKESWAVKFRKLWTTETVIASFKATIKKRPNQGRKQIFVLLICMSLVALHKAVYGTLGYSYAHQRYNWGNTQYSTVSATLEFVGTLSMLFVVPLSKKVKMGDATLGIVGALSMLGKDIALGLASTESIYYIANLVGLVDGLLGVASRSRVSKVANRHDTGKVFSFLSFAQSFVPICANVGVAQVFNATLTIFPGLIFLILGAISLLPFMVFIWILRLPKADYDVPEDTAVESQKSKDSFSINERKDSTRF